MRQRNLTLPQLGLIAGTRVALGAGIGLLIAERLKKDRRKVAGWALFGLGVATTIPIAAGVVFGKGPFARKRHFGLVA